MQRHLQLSQALRDLTGQRIIRAIVVGGRAPQRLAALRHSRGKKAADDIAMALTGPWREEHLCILTQALALFDRYPTQRSAWAAQIARVFSVIKPRFETPDEAAKATSAAHSAASQTPLPQQEYP